MEKRASLRLPALPTAGRRRQARDDKNVYTLPRWGRTVFDPYRDKRDPRTDPAWRGRPLQTGRNLGKGLSYMGGEEKGWGIRRWERNWSLAAAQATVKAAASRRTPRRACQAGQASRRTPHESSLIIGLYVGEVMELRNSMLVLVLVRRLSKSSMASTVESGLRTLRRTQTRLNSSVGRRSSSLRVPER